MSFPILKLLLVLTNFFLTSFLLILTCDHFYSHDDIQSWGFLFHVLSLSWLFIRGIFWLATIVPIVKWTTLSFYLLYWMPAPLEFAAFMLLPLYFTQILYPDEWKKHWNNVRPFYFSFIVGIILFQVLWTWLADTPEEERCAAATDANLKYKCFQTEDPSDLFRIVTGICFVFVAIMQYNFGLKVLQLDLQRYAHYFTTPSDMMATVNKFLAFSFATRSIYQFLAVLTDVNLPNIPIEAGEGDIDFWVFILFELWIYAPTMLIVANVTSKTLQERSITDVGYRVIARTYGAIESIPMVEAHPADLEDSVEMRMVHNGPNSREVSAVVPIQNQGQIGENGYLFGSLSSNHSSFNRTTWLSEPDNKRYIKPGSSQDNQAQCGPESVGMDKPGSFLTKYYYNKRIRSGSLNSEASSGETSHSNSNNHIAGSFPHNIDAMNGGYGIFSNSVDLGGRTMNPITDQQFRSHHRANSFGSHSNVPVSSSFGSSKKSYRGRQIRFYNEGGKSKSANALQGNHGSAVMSESLPTKLGVVKASLCCSFDRGHHQNVFMPTLSSDLVRETILDQERTPSLGREMELFHKQAQKEIQQQQQHQSAGTPTSAPVSALSPLLVATSKHFVQDSSSVFNGVNNSNTNSNSRSRTPSSPFELSTVAITTAPICGILGEQHYELQVEPGTTIDNNAPVAQQQQGQIRTSPLPFQSNNGNNNPFAVSFSNRISSKSPSFVIGSNTSRPTPPPVLNSNQNPFHKSTSRETLLAAGENEILEGELPAGFQYSYDSNSNLMDYFASQSQSQLQPSIFLESSNNNNNSNSNSNKTTTTIHHNTPMYSVPPPTSSASTATMANSSQPQASMAAMLPTAILPRPSRPNIASSRFIAHHNPVLSINANNSNNNNTTNSENMHTSGDTPPLLMSYPRSVHSQGSSSHALNPFLMSMMMATPSPANASHNNSNGNTQHPSRITTPSEALTPVDYSNSSYPTISGCNPNLQPPIMSVPTRDMTASHNVNSSSCQMYNHLYMDPPLTPDNNSSTVASNMSFSPGSVLLQRFQAETASLTPDRVEAAKEAARLRQGLGGGRHNRSFTFSPHFN